MSRTLFLAYAAQGYISLTGILLMPVFLNLMGAEAFGLIGFFLMLQSLLQVVDLGLSPTLSREMSLYRAGVIDSIAAWQRLRSLEWILSCFALMSVTVFIVFRHTISSSWLSFEHLSPDDVVICLMLMASTAALRWLTGLYRSGLNGIERQILVNSMGVVFVTLKFGGVLPLLLYFSASPVVFFEYQFLIGILELAAFARAMYREISGSAMCVFPSWAALRSMSSIAGSMAFLSAIWIFTTQIDKLVLSKLLSLEEYGYFTLAIMLAGGLLMLILPFNQVIQPRMTILASQGKSHDLRELYLLATQFITALFIALGGTLSLFAEQILFAWTGNTETARIAAPVLFWYGLANALIGILIMPFMLQFAHGYLRLHVIGNLLLSITLLPALIYASIKYGGEGAGAILLSARFLFLFFWVPLVHRRLLPGTIWTWPLFNVGKIAITIIIFLVVAHELLPLTENRLSAVFIISIIFAGSLSVGLLTGDRSRRTVIGLIGSRT